MDKDETFSLWNILSVMWNSTCTRGFVLKLAGLQGSQRRHKIKSLFLHSKSNMNSRKHQEKTKRMSPTIQGLHKPGTMIHLIITTTIIMVCDNYTWSLISIGTSLFPCFWDRQHPQLYNWIMLFICAMMFLVFSEFLKAETEQTKNQNKAAYAGRVWAV